MALNRAIFRERLAAAVVRDGGRCWCNADDDGKDEKANAGGGEVNPEAAWSDSSSSRRITGFMVVMEVVVVVDSELEYSTVQLDVAPNHRHPK